MIPRLNLLFSYAYMRSSPDYTEHICNLSPAAQVMIDCGAFTVHHQEIKVAKKGGKSRPLTIDEYIKACKGWHGRVDHYIALDVIMKAKESRQNLLKMADAGLTPMPVFVQGESWDYIPQMMKINPYICVGGIVGDVVGLSSDYAHYRYSKVKKVGGPKAEVHALGFVRYPEAYNLPIRSGDSSSFCSGGRFGSIIEFNPRTGFSNTSWKELWEGSRETQRTLGRLRKMNISLKRIRDRASYSKTYGITGLVSTHAYIMFHQHATKQGFEFYFAIPNINWANNIYAILPTMDNGYFDYPQARKNKIHLDEVWKRDPQKHHQIVMEWIKNECDV